MKDDMYYQEAAYRMLQAMQSTSTSPVNKNARELSYGENGVLSCLSFRTEGVTAGELKDMLGIGASGVTNLLNALEKKGLIRREISLEDRRKIIVHISESGLSIVRHKQEEMVSFIKETLIRLGKEDTEELLRIAEKISVIDHQSYIE